MKASSIGWNLAGLAAPLLVALWAIPLLLRQLGAERFGLLSLAWALTSMAGLFDLGIGRATTRLAAELAGRGERHRLRATLASAQRVAWATGCAGGALLALAVAAGAAQLIRVGPALAGELDRAGYLLALAIPLQTTIATYRGLNEALQRFRGISLLRMALGVANFGAPLAAAQFTREIGPLVGALVLARALAWLGYRQLAHAAIGTPRGTAVGPAARGLAGHEMRALLAAGGWFTVSAVVSPLLVQADRFFIGARLSAAAVPSYTVPFDIITQLLVFVTAVSTVAFPSIAAQRATDAAAAHAVFVRWRRRVGGGMALICAGVAWALPAALERWVGGTLASAALADAVVVGRWLCLGVWLNALGAMQLAWMHGHGRFRATALLHLAELGPYLLALWLLLPVCGVAGAAMAWVGRVAIDTLMLSWLARSRLAGAPR